MAKITDVFSLWKSVKDPKKRGNFFYYNNRITIICDEAKGDSNCEFYC